MRLFGVRATLRRGITVAGGGGARRPHCRLHIFAAPRPQLPSAETRALWVLRSSLASPESIATLIRTARDHGFNTLLVQVRGRGDAYYNGGLEPRAAELNRQPRVVRSAGHRPRRGARRGPARPRVGQRQPGLERRGSARSRATHIVYRHPEWLMVPRDLAQELSRDQGRRVPAYVGKLARWTRTQPSVEGLYASPISPRPPTTSTRSSAIWCARYDVDGVHLDYARYPSGSVRLQPRRHSRVPRRCPANAARRGPPRSRCARSRRPAAVPGHVSGGVAAFRIARMTALVGRLRNTVKSTRGGNRRHRRGRPRLQEARDHRLQDWGAWLEDGLVDAVCPMAYTPEPARFAEQIAAAREVCGRPRSLGRHRRVPDHAGRRRSRISRPRGGWARRASSCSRTTAWSIPGRRRRTTSPSSDVQCSRSPPLLPTEPADSRAPHDADLGRLRGHRRLSPGDHRVRLVVRAIPEDHPRLLPERSLRTLVGDLLHHRRDRNQHAELHRRPRAGVRRAT